MSFSRVYCTYVQCTCRSMKRWEKRRWGTRHVLRWVVNVVVHLGGLTGRGILYKHTIAIFYSSAQDTWEGLWYDWSQFCWCLFLVWFVDSSVMFYVVDVICTLVCSVNSVLRWKKCQLEDYQTLCSVSGYCFWPETDLTFLNVRIRPNSRIALH